MGKGAGMAKGVREGWVFLCGGWRREMGEANAGAGAGLGEMAAAGTGMTEEVRGRLGRVRPCRLRCFCVSLGIGGGAVRALVEARGFPPPT